MGVFNISYHQVSPRLFTPVSLTFGDVTVSTQGFFDTGAMVSCVSRELAERIGATSVGTTGIRTITGIELVPLYEVGIVLPNETDVGTLRLGGGTFDGQGADLVIGMDVINMGDLSVSCKDGVTRMSFRMPSAEDADFLHRKLGYTVS